MGLIAAKPVKPCDRGVFGVFNSLLIPERENSKTGSIQPNPHPVPARPGNLNGLLQWAFGQPVHSLLFAQ